MFNDVATGDSQDGSITYKHTDSTSQGGGAAFHFTGEPDLTLILGDGTYKGRFVASSQGSDTEVDYGFYGDVNTGMVRTSADNVSLVAGGVRGIGVGATAVSLKYAGSTKLATSNTGATVTGNLTVTNDIYATGDLDVRDIDARAISASSHITGSDVHIDDWGSVSASLSTIQQAGGVNGSGAANRIALWSDSDTLTSDVGLTYSSDTLFLDDADYTSMRINADVKEHSSVQFMSSSVNVGRIGWHEQGYFASSAMGVNPSPAMFINAPNGFDFAHNNTGSLSIKSGSADVIIDSKVNVGIGAATPVYKLDVRGDIGTDRYIRHTGDTNTYFGFSGPDTIQFNTAGSERLRINSSGNVGIGTDSPTGKFNSYISATRQLTHNGNGGDLSIISDNNSDPVMFIKGTGGADLLNVFDNTTEVFTILDGGNVGIGITSPQTKLHVAGPATDASAATLRIGGPSNGTGNNVSRLELVENTTNSNADMSYGYSFTADGNDSNNLLIKNHSNSIAGNLAISVERTTGNVGIGTNPGAQLHVYGTSTIGWNTMGNARALFGTTGGGIGIDSNEIVQSGTGGMYIGTKDASDLVFRTGGANARLTISSGGTATFTGNVTINGSSTLGDSTADSTTIGLKHLLGYCENTDVDTGTETIKELALATYQAVFFDYVVKNGTNLRAGTVTAVHDGSNVEFTDTSTKDLGNTSAVILSVDISGTNMRLRATTTSDNWIVKANIRGIKV